jgi:hypothetical protein
MADTCEHVFDWDHAGVVRCRKYYVAGADVAEPAFTSYRAQLAARLTPEKLLRAHHAAIRAPWPAGDMQAAVALYIEEPGAIDFDAMRQSLLDTLTGEGE